MKPAGPPLLRQDVPIAPVGVYVVSVTGETRPVEVKYNGLAGGRHQWLSVSKYRMAEAHRVGWTFVPPLTDVHVVVKP